jgi:glycosyltransferase involved in cell wall biosynthesis
VIRATAEPGTVRVLHVCEPTEAGAAAVAFQLASGLRADGVEAVVCTPVGRLSCWCDGADIPVVELPFERRSLRSYGRAIRRIRRLAAEGGFSIIHAHSSFAGALVRLARTAAFPAVVFQPHAWSFLAVPRPLRRPLQLVERRLAQRTDLLLCVSPEELALARAAGISARREKVIPNGVAFPERPRSRVRLGQPPIAGCMARLSRQKGVDVLIRAVASPDWPRQLAVEVVGTGPMEEELRDLAARVGVGDRVRFLGYAEEPGAMLSQWDLFVLPSRYEGAPLALLEALAAGLVVIATRVAGVAGVMGEGGWTVPVGDPGALAQAVARALDDWPRAVAASEAARHRASREFSLDTQLRRVLSAYRELV